MSSGDGILRDEDNDSKKEGDHEKDNDEEGNIHHEIFHEKSVQEAGVELNLDNGESDWSPYTKTRKRRGTITRRR